MRYAAGAGVMLPMARLLPGCGDGSEGGTGAGEEIRSFYFDLRHAAAGSRHTLFIGERRYELEPVTSKMLAQARQTSAWLRAIPDSHVTHRLADVPVHAGVQQLCHVKSTSGIPGDSSWGLPLMFFHTPRSSLRSAQARVNPHQGLFGDDLVSLKREFHGLELPAGGEDDSVELDDFKDLSDQAVSMVFQHPELLSGVSDSAAHIQQNVIARQSSTLAMAIKLRQQGEATESGGWATLEPYIDPTTGQPYLNSQGQKQYFVNWSTATMTSAGPAIHASLTVAKNDPTLGVNITDLDPAAGDPSLEGKIWKVRDGEPTVQAPTRVALAEGGSSFTFVNQATEHGYRAKVAEVGSGRVVTVDLENWFVRYLGIYVRYLDAAGNPIAVADLPQSTRDRFPDWAQQFSGKYDSMAVLMGPEWELLSIPLKEVREEITFEMPDSAASALVMASGWGRSGPDRYTDTIDPGIICTSLINLAVPGFFLILGAPTGFLEFVGDLDQFAYVRLISDLLVNAGFNIFVAAEYHDPATLVDFAKTLGEFILSASAVWIVTRIRNAVSAEEPLDQVPFLGGILFTIGALTLVSAVTQTIAESENSPETYVNKLSFTHDLQVTVQHDPNDFEFPAVATYYVLTAIFDQGTPVDSGPIPMPAGTVSEPIGYTFPAVPFGGRVNVSISFYSADGWLAGKGETGAVANTTDEVEITITENHVPLTSTTIYSHKEKTALDANGHVVWLPTTTPPTATAGNTTCATAVGSLCNLIGITVSQQYAAVGYTWEAYSPAVQSCESGGSGQLHQLANLALTQNPQTGRLAPSCGYAGPLRIVYDLMGNANNNFYVDPIGGRQLVRQIRLSQSGPPTMDGPTSNLAWGKFGNPSDALLLHPGGQLISISAQFNKIEVLDLPASASPDDYAAPAMAYSGTGIREGLVNGPVAAALTPEGVILILESKNLRIQAFDIGANPSRHFKQGAYFVPLKSETESVRYLDMAVESGGYIYVLSATLAYVYRLDIYAPDGEFVSRTVGVNAARLAIDFWRNAYTLNYEILRLPNGNLPSITEPSISQWIPSTP